MIADLWPVLALTFKVGVLATVGTLPVAIGVAALLTHGRLPGRAILEVLVRLPLVLPPVVTGWLLLALLGAQSLPGRLLSRVGIHLPFTTAGAALACAVMIAPFMIQSIRLSIDAIDPAMLRVASSLGAGRSDRLISIILPLALPGILSAILSGLASSIGEFGAVITFAANIPGVSRTLPLAIYTSVSTPGADQATWALVIIAIVLAIGLLWGGRYLLETAFRFTPLR